MARDGLYWYTDPGVIAQKFTARAASFGGELGGLVSISLDKATQQMRQSVMTRGVYRGVPTGGPRIDSGAMYSSINSKMLSSAGNKVSGQFGFINDAPFYTIYQEFGTRTTGWGQGIRPMMAFSDAQEYFVNDLSKSIQVHEWWSNF
jgi:hypothetical protein